VDLDVNKGTVILAPLEGVARVTVLFVVTIRGSTVGEQDHYLVDGLGVLAEVILVNTITNDSGEREKGLT
jgi:hypothetical protein